MAGLAAEGDRFGMFVSAITPERAHEDEDNAQGDEGKESATAIRIRDSFNRFGFSRTKGSSFASRSLRTWVLSLSKRTVG
jgi:hypothetical protein